MFGEKGVTSEAVNRRYETAWFVGTSPVLKQYIKHRVRECSNPFFVFRYKQHLFAISFECKSSLMPQTFYLYHKSCSWTRSWSVSMSSRKPCYFCSPSLSFSLSLCLSLSVSLLSLSVSLSDCLSVSQSLCHCLCLSLSLTQVFTRFIRTLIFLLLFLFINVVVVVTQNLSL